tara:strand:- start:1003 stop:1509 length:507 start_codon:yes stop_codon:yes gene_type:complete
MLADFSGVELDDITSIERGEYTSVDIAKCLASAMGVDDYRILCSDDDVVANKRKLYSTRLVFVALSFIVIWLTLEPFEKIPEMYEKAGALTVIEDMRELASNGDASMTLRQLTEESDAMRAYISIEDALRDNGVFVGCIEPDALSLEMTVEELRTESDRALECAKASM